MSIQIAIEERHGWLVRERDRQRLAQEDAAFAAAARSLPRSDR